MAPGPSIGYYTLPTKGVFETAQGGIHRPCRGESEETSFNEGITVTS